MGIKRNLLETAVTAMRLAWRTRKVRRPFTIFILRNNDLGDLVVVTPLFKALRQAFPDSKIVVGVCSASKDILKHNPYVSEVVDCNAPWHNHHSRHKSLTRPLRYIFASSEVDRLKDYKFDVGIDVLGSPFGSMLMLQLGIPIRLGRKGYAGGHSGATAYLENTTLEPVAKGALGFVKLLKPQQELDSDTKPQLFLSESEIAEAREVWSEIEGLSGTKGPRIVVAPGAGIPEKQWPVERFAELSARFSAQMTGCILGSRADIALGETIVRRSKGWSNRCGKVSIRDSMALISLADVVVCNSSFVMHIASAFHKPAVVILTRVLDSRIHAYFWEVAGLHHQLYPLAGDEHVSVDAVEQKTLHLMASIRKPLLENASADSHDLR